MLLQSDRSIPDQFCLLKFYRPIGKDFCLLIESALIALSDQELSRAFRRFKVSVKYSFRAVDIFFLVVDSQSIIQIKRETVTAFMNYFTCRYWLIDSTYYSVLLAYEEHLIRKPNNIVGLSETVSKLGNEQ